MELGIFLGPVWRKRIECGDKLGDVAEAEVLESGLFMLAPGLVGPSEHTDLLVLKMLGHHFDKKVFEDSCLSIGILKRKKNSNI